MDYKLTQSNRIDSTPFTSRNALAGVSSYTIYNKTLLPTIFNSYFCVMYLVEILKQLTNLNVITHL